MKVEFNAWLAAIATTVALAAHPVAATTVTVDLDLLDIGTEYIDDSVLGSPGFGGQGPVTIDWSPFDDPGLDLIRWGAPSYSGRHAAYCGNGLFETCGLDLTVASGFSLTLDSFWLGGYPDTDENINWFVYDLADLSTPVVDAAGDVFVSGTTGRTHVIGATSETGFRILFGPDAFNGGINDIVYTYQSLNGGGGGGVSPIPLPAAGWLLIAGLGGLAALRRRG